MLLILEVTFFLFGLYFLVVGKLPQRVFNAFFGRKEYAASSSRVRLLGLILAAPFSIALCSGLILGFVFGEDAIAIAGIIDLSLTVAVTVIVILMVRGMRVAPETVAAEAEGENT